MRINHRSDFSFTLRLLDAAGEDMGVPPFDWRCRLWTFSRANAYEASSVGGVMTNCTEAEGRIRVIVDGHRMGCGTLKAEVEALVPDGEYGDGTQRVVTVAPTGIVLVAGESSRPDSVDVQVQAPIVRVCQSAYDLAVKAGYTGTFEAYCHLLDRLPDLAARLEAEEPERRPYTRISLEVADGSLFMRGEWKRLLEAGYRPFLFRSTVKHVRYLTKDGFRHRRIKGWNRMGTEDTVKVGDDGQVLFADCGHELWDKPRMHESYTSSPEVLAEPHHPKDTVTGEIYEKRMVVSWGRRNRTIWDVDEEGNTHYYPQSLRYGIGFAAPDDILMRRVTTDLLVTNLAKFTVVYAVTALFDNSGNFEQWRYGK